MSDDIAVLDPGRALVVGASEVASLFSYEWPEPSHPPYETLLHLWLRKRGELPPEEDDTPRDRTFWGRYLEPGIAAGFQELLGVELHRARHVVHPEVAAGASLDRMAVCDDYEPTPSGVHFPLWGPIPVELKNLSIEEWRRWPEATERSGVEELDQNTGKFGPAKKRPPLRMLLQVQQQMACTAGSEAALLCVLVGGNAPVVYLVWRHQPSIDRCLDAVRRFWESVRSGERPGMAHVSDSDTVIALHQLVEHGKVLHLGYDKELIELCDRQVDEGKKLRALEAEAKNRKAQILTRIGNAERVILPGFSISAGFIEGGETITQRTGYRACRIRRAGSRNPQRKGGA